ncbi:hypothetical protein [Streptomyces sp. SYSU K217416]
MSTPAAMPGARQSLTGSIAALIAGLTEALDQDTIDLDGVQALTGLVAQYNALLTIQNTRTANRP